MCPKYLVHRSRSAGTYGVVPVLHEKSLTQFRGSQSNLTSTKIRRYSKSCFKATQLKALVLESVLYPPFLNPLKSRCSYPLQCREIITKLAFPFSVEGEPSFICFFTTHKSLASLVLTHDLFVDVLVLPRVAIRIYPGSESSFTTVFPSLVSQAKVFALMPSLWSFTLRTNFG